MDAALIRGVELKVVLIQSKAVSKSGTLSLSLLLILQYILEIFNETKFNETIFCLINTFNIYVRISNKPGKKYKNLAVQTCRLSGGTSTEMPVSTLS